MVTALPPTRGSQWRMPRWANRARNQPIARVRMAAKMGSSTPVQVAGFARENAVFIGRARRLFDPVQGHNAAGPRKCQASLDTGVCLW